jgi:hypothetical protein
VTTHYGARAGMLLCGVVPVLAAAVTAAALSARRRRAGTGAVGLADTGPIPVPAARA